MRCLPHSVITHERGVYRGTKHSFQCLFHDSRFAQVLGSSYEVFCHEKECASGNGNDCSPDIFFRVINEIRCPSYLQYKRGSLKKALTERYLSHSSLMFSAVRTKGPVMRRCRTVITDRSQRTEGHQLLARVAGSAGASGNDACFASPPSPIGS
jgi:hypothetical protein